MVTVKIGTTIPASNKITQKIDHKECLRLIAEGELNFAQIGLKLGCTRERVRQIAKRDLGILGYQEQGRRKGDKFRKILPAHPFIAEAQRRGLIVEIVMGTVRPLSRIVMVNEIKTYLSRAIDQPLLGPMVVRIVPTQQNCDVMVWVVRNIGFLILPKEKQPPAVTSFAIELRRPNMGAITNRHDYRDYLNAWGVFKERQ